MDRDTHDEIMRLRDRAHSLGGEVAAHGHTLSDLAVWRRGVDASLAELGREVGEMVKADEMADAIAARVNRDHTLRLSTFTKVCTAVVGVSTFAASVKVLVGL